MCFLTDFCFYFFFLLFFLCFFSVTVAGARKANQPVEFMSWPDGSSRVSFWAMGHVLAVCLYFADLLVSFCCFVCLAQAETKI